MASPDRTRSPSLAPARRPTRLWPGGLAPRSPATVAGTNSRHRRRSSGGGPGTGPSSPPGPRTFRRRSCTASRPSVRRIVGIRARGAGASPRSWGPRCRSWPRRELRLLVVPRRLESNRPAPDCNIPDLLGRGCLTAGLKGLLHLRLKRHPLIGHVVSGAGRRASRARMQASAWSAGDMALRSSTPWPTLSSIRD
jgi:hypothetical protein